MTIEVANITNTVGEVPHLVELPTYPDPLSSIRWGLDKSFASSKDFTSILYNGTHSRPSHAEVEGERDLETLPRNIVSDENNFISG